MPYVRVVYSKRDPAKIETAIANFRQKVAPAAWSAPGYVAAELKVNRETGEAIALTGWETQEAMNTSEQMAQETRRQAQEATGALIVDIERFEIFLRHGSGKRPTLPGFVDWTEFYGDLDRIDPTINFVETRVKDNVSAQPGYRALNCAINRMTGRLAIVFTWESAKARAANSQTVGGLWQEAARLAGGKDVRVMELEVVFFHGRTASGEFLEAEGPAVAD